GIDTVREVINRWAPGVENNTEAYIKAVAAGVDVTPNQPIDLRNFRTLIAITTGIIQHENGSVPYAAPINPWNHEGLRRFRIGCHCNIDADVVGKDAMAVVGQHLLLNNLCNFAEARKLVGHLAVPLKSGNVSQAASAASMGDAGTVEVSAATGRSVLDIRAGIIADQAALKAAQAQQIRLGSVPSLRCLDCRPKEVIVAVMKIRFLLVAVNFRSYRLIEMPFAHPATILDKHSDAFNLSDIIPSSIDPARSAIKARDDLITDPEGHRARLVGLAMLAGRMRQIGEEELNEMIELSDAARL
nr:hypothetical protein [Tanacetum cinerariifolium]